MVLFSHISSAKVKGYSVVFVVYDAFSVTGLYNVEI
jgi:hypothetical protein